MNRRKSQSISELGYSTEGKDSILKTCVERKEIGVESLLKWRETTTHNVRVSQEFIEELFLRLELLLQDSSKRFSIVIQFLETLAFSIHSDLKFASNVKLYCLDRERPLDSLYAQKWDKLRDVEPILFAVLELNREYEVFAEKLRNVRKQIKETIVDKLLRKDIEPYEKTVEQLKRQSRGINKLLLKRSEECEAKLKKFEKLKIEWKAEKRKEKRVRKNLFDGALEFTLGVKALEDALADFGLLFIANWKQCCSLEAKRISATRNSLVGFVEILTEVFGADVQKSFQNR